MTTPSAPKGLTKKKTTGRFEGKFASTVMGTALFVAEMQKKVPLRTKLAIAALVAVITAAGIVGSRVHTAAQEREAALASAVALEDGEGADEVRALVAEGLSAASLVTAYGYLGDARDPESVPLLIAGLDQEPEPRRAAARAIAKVGSPAADSARDRLTALLSDEVDPADRTLFAWALTLLGGVEGIDVVVEALADGSLSAVEGFRTRTFARVLGVVGLKSRLTHGSPPVRQFAAAWLGHVCDPSVVGPLIEATEDTEQNVVLAAAVSLGQCDTPEALAAIEATAGRNESIREPLYRAFANQVGAPGFGALLRVQLTERQRSGVLDALLALRDPRAGDVLMAVLETSVDDERLRLTVARGLAEIADPRLFDVVEPMLDGELGAEALGLLGLGRAEDVEAALFGLLARRRFSQRALVFRAMGEAGVCSEDAQSQMLLALRRDDTRTEALRALGRCGHQPVLEFAMGVVKRPVGERARVTASDGELRLAAFDVIARLGQADPSGDLYEIVDTEETDARLRMAAADALGIVADEATLDRAVDRATDPRTPAGVRQGFAQALRHRVPRAALPRLMGYLRSGEDDARSRTAVTALATAADPQMNDELLELLDDERARVNAGIAVALGGDEEGARRLVALTRRDGAYDTELRTRLMEHEFLFDAAALDDGRIHRLVGRLLALRDAGVGAVFTACTQKMAESADHPGAIGSRELRRAFARDLVEGDDDQRHMAAEVLFAMGERGILLAVRATEAAGATEADEVLAPDR